MCEAKDSNLWDSLNGSPAVCRYYRDGQTRSPDQIAFQFNRSLARAQNNDPRCLRIIQKEVNGELLDIGTVVLGGSSEEDYLEWAIMMHPLYDTETCSFIANENDVGCYFSSDDAQKNPQWIPLWNQGIGKKVAHMTTSDERIQQFKGACVDYTWYDGQEEYRDSFNGNMIKGIIATSSNPASQKILENAGFEYAESKHAFGVEKRVYKKHFIDDDHQ